MQCKHASKHVFLPENQVHATERDALQWACTGNADFMVSCRQARKLQEMFQKVQQENEMLRRGRGAPGGQLGSAGGQQFNDMLSPAHHMQPPNAPGSGRVVSAPSAFS